MADLFLARKLLLERLVAYFEKVNGVSGIF